MLTTHDITQSPLAVTVRGSDGDAHTITVAPRQRGRVVVSCSCMAFGRESWCRHVVDLFCMKLRDCGVTDPDIDERFEEIIAGTILESAAHDVDLTIAAYERAATMLQTVQGALQPATLTRDALEAVASASRDVAQAAEAASDAVRRLQRNISCVDVSAGR